ncbi:unnamed protein product [Pylaiella littoralis]
MLQGYEAAQERLKDAAQLIRTLREALASRDADANAAVDRARKFQREASDLRRRLETSSSIVGNNSSRGVTPAGGGRGEENTMRSSAVAGGGVGRGGGGGSGGGGGGGDYVDQQQQQRGLKSEVERLKLELQGQREACVAATSEGDELKATVREVGEQLRDVDDLRQGGLAADNARANAAAELARELARARSTAESSRAEAKRLRRQLQQAKPSESGGDGRGSGSCDGGGGGGGSLHRIVMPRCASCSANLGRTGPRRRFGYSISAPVQCCRPLPCVSA